MRLENVTMRWRKKDAVPVIENVSLSVKRGEIVALIGPSGCGKSTLLNLLAGLLTTDSGRVDIPADADVAYVFQHPRLLPWRDVQSNVLYGLESRRIDGATARERAAHAIELVNLAGSEHKYPHQLSGGMQQRVALARGLALEPSISLLDEPFGALDALTRGYLQEELAGIVRGTEMTTVLVTHDIDEALLLADRIAVMTARPGRIDAVEDVPFGPERSLDGLLADPRYPVLRGRLRAMLRPQVEVPLEESV